MGHRLARDEEEGSAILLQYHPTTPKAAPTRRTAERSVRGIKGYGELVGNRRIPQATGEDVTTGTATLFAVSSATRSSGPDKGRLASSEATRLVESASKDHFDHGLTPIRQPRGYCSTASPSAREPPAPAQATRAGAQDRDPQLRLPGKLADCTRE